MTSVIWLIIMYYMVTVSMFAKSFVMRPKRCLRATESDDFFDFEYDSGIVKTVKRNGDYKVKDNRDALPFEVFLEKTKPKKVIQVKTRDQEKLGTYLLDATCSNDDVVVLHGMAYLVKRVSFIYKWEPRNGLRVVKKKIHVIEDRAPSALADQDPTTVLQ
jgi:hypothetical protein